MQAIAQSVYQYHAASKRDCSALLSLHQQAVQWQGCVPPSPPASTTPGRQATSPPYHQPHAYFVLRAMCFVPRVLRFGAAVATPLVPCAAAGAPWGPRADLSSPTQHDCLQHRSVGASFSVLNPTDCSCPETRALELVPWGWAGNWAGNDRRTLSERAQLVPLTAHAQRQNGRGMQR
jgi:hypothetical protein